MKAIEDCGGKKPIKIKKEENKKTDKKGTKKKGK